MVPLHVKSHYSIGLGAASIEQLIERASHFGLSALGLTDVGNLYGQPLFHDVCRRAGLRPITGVELPWNSTQYPGRLVLLAQNARGYRSLCRAISDVRRGVATLEALAPNAEGLFLLTDSPELLERLPTGESGGEPPYALLSRPGDRHRETQLRLTAERIGAPLCADPEIELLEPEDCERVRLIAAARSNRLLAGNEARALTTQHWFRPLHELERLFADVPDAIATNVRIAAECDFELRRARPLELGAETFGAEASVLLTERCNAGLAAARAVDRCRGAQYDTRLASELEIVIALGHAGYVLAAADVADVARRAGISTAPRGSAAGSLVIHLLGISPIDPIERGLHFERFLNATRTSAPDIDLDVASDKRDELIRTLFARFGRTRVANVGTQLTFQRDSALRAGLKALGATAAETSRFMDALARTTAMLGDNADVTSVARTALAPRWQAAVPLMLQLIDKPRSVGVHPSSVVIAPVPVRDIVPVEPGRDGRSVTQFDLRGIERVGLTKLDLLGNHFLSQLRTTELLLGRECMPSLPSCDDGPTLERIDRADTIGCFQIETPALRAVLTRLPIARIDDCVDALARVRPGASGEDSARVGEETEGVPTSCSDDAWLFDEDLMEALADAAAISLAEADRLRVAVIDAATPEAAAILERDFVERARANGRDPDRARTVWTKATRFATNTFCKAHAWSYGMLAYWSAYLKTHYLQEHGCALLDSYGGAYPLRTIAADLLRSGVRIEPPSVNRSNIANHLIDRRGVSLGLSALKHLRRKTADAIVSERTSNGRFQSLDDLERRVHLSSRERAALVRVGACDDLAPLSAALYPFAHEALLCDPDARRWLLPAENERTARYAALVRARNEIELLGMHVTHHPLALLRDDAERCGCLPVANIARDAAESDTIRLVGLVAADHRHLTSRQSMMAFVTFEDETGLIEATVAPQSYRRLARRMTTAGPYLVDGTVHIDRGAMTIHVTALAPFYERSTRMRSAAT
jgi:DNA polymerase III alpha subunit